MLKKTAERNRMSAVAEKLPKTMGAVICHAPEDYRMEERDVPKPGPGEVVVKVKTSSLILP